MTPGELESHRRELDRLLEIRDRDLPALLRNARTFVASDAAEEIAQIREDHHVVEARIRQLEELVYGAGVRRDTVAPDVVEVGRVIEVEYVQRREIARYRVTGTAVPGGRGTLSARSPLGQALVGRIAGETVTVALPAGHVEELRIVSVADDEEAPWR